ncbi:MAG: Hsp20 family protein [Hyphomicrobiales bacterium]|nr:MAG: Hsp20 family protein [Hyphomicrobiales bacterium]
MQTIDFSPFYRSTVGFDRLFNRLDGLVGHGFAESDIVIESKENSLSIKGAKAPEGEDSKREFLHRGIAERAFELRFQLAEYVEVTGASLANGLLHVDLKRELPESKKARTIAIGAGTKTIEDQTVN